MQTNSSCLRFDSQATLDEFTAALAAKTSAPGGGSAAALVGAVGVSLASMAAHFTISKPQFMTHEKALNELLEEVSSVRVALLSLVDEDAKGLAHLMSVYKIPKDNPQRSDLLQQALQGAYKAPLAMMEQICSAIDILDKMSSMCAPMLLSDVGSGALICRAALEAASYNVLVNIRLLHDKQEAQAVDTRCSYMLTHFVAQAEACAERIRRYMKG